MNRFVRVLVAIFLAVCLPMQTVGAVTMPFCEAGGTASMPMADLEHGMAMDHAGHDMDHHPDGDADAQHGLGCNECGLCHLAYASALPSSMPMLADVLQCVHQAALTANVTSFQPDPVHKPPRGDLR